MKHKKLKRAQKTGGKNMRCGQCGLPFHTAKSMKFHHCRRVMSDKTDPLDAQLQHLEAHFRERSTRG